MTNLPQLIQPTDPKAQELGLEDANATTRRQEFIDFILEQTGCDDLDAFLAMDLPTPSGGDLIRRAIKHGDHAYWTHPNVTTKNPGWAAQEAMRKGYPA